MHLPSLTSHNQAATDAGSVVDEGVFDFSLENDAEEVPKMNSESVFPLTTAAAEGSDLFSIHEPIEDLEWLSNKDAFPSVETCSDILSENLEFILNNYSPVSIFKSNDSPTTTVAELFKVLGSFPVRPRSKNRRRKRRTAFCKMPSLRAGMEKRCSHCQADKTPQWRAGPMGPKTLCNACGVRYKSGRLVPEYRPANSPTFSSVLHSNSHRKVVEIRRKKYQEGGA